MHGVPLPPGKDDAGRREGLFPQRIHPPRRVPGRTCRSTEARDRPRRLCPGSQLSELRLWATLHGVFLGKRGGTGRGPLATAKSLGPGPTCPLSITGCSSRGGPQHAGPEQTCIPGLSVHPLDEVLSATPEGRLHWPLGTSLTLSASAAVVACVVLMPEHLLAPPPQKLESTGLAASHSREPPPLPEPPSQLPLWPMPALVTAHAGVGAGEELGGRQCQPGCVPAPSPGLLCCSTRLPRQQEPGSGAPCGMV